MKQDDPHQLLEPAIANSGRDAVVSVLKKMVDPPQEVDTLTVIGNAGVHTIPEKYCRGEIYEVSRGSWDVESAQQLNNLFSDMLTGLVEKLREKSWRRIYFIPTGHPTLSIQIKTLIYRILRQNTVDLYHNNGVYFEIDIDHREIAVKANAQNEQIPGEDA